MSDVPVIGLGGPSGSGKSTLTHILAHKLTSAVVLRQDWFFYDDPEIEVTANFCDDRYLDSAAFVLAVQQLSEGAPAIVPDLDEQTFRVSGSRVIQPMQWVIVEGMTVLRYPPVLGLLRHAYYLAPPEAVIIARKHLRDQADRGRTAEVVDAQLDWVLAEYRSDLRSLPPGVRLLDGDLPCETLAAMILDDCA